MLMIAHSASPLTRRRRYALLLAAAYPGILVALELVQLFLPIRSGPLALAALVAPYLLLPLGLLLPLLLLRGAGLLRLAIALCLLLNLRNAPRLPAPPAVAASDAATLTILTWNVAFGQADPRATQQFVESRPADIVALEEDYSTWWDPDPAVWQAREVALARIYPYQIRYQHGAPQGLTILSVYPILERATVAGALGERDSPPVTWGRFDLGHGRTIVVVAAHPRNPTRSGCSLRRLCYDPSERDAQIDQIRATVDPLLSRAEPLLLIGDFNLTDREPAYHEVSHGLWDAYRIVGSGMGHTWGPRSLAGSTLPLLRIDYLFGNSGVQPLRLTPNCLPRGSDHCALLGQVAVR